MKEIRKIINENIHLFNSDEPTEGHFERFEAKLDRIDKERKRNLLYKLSITVTSAAAALVLAFFITIKMNSGSFMADKLPTEVKEMKYFYENRIEQNYKTLNSVANCAGQKREVEKCIDEFERSMKEIQKDIEENPGDEHLLNALANHYKVRLEVTDRMISRFKEYCF